MNTKDLLLLFFEGLDIASRPHIALQSKSFDPWVAKHGLAAEIEQLRHQRMLHWDTIGLTRRIPRLSARAKQRRSGIEDPTPAWNREWDGFWITVNYDVPEKQRLMRRSLRKLLEKEGFGLLQRSLWVSPDAPAKLVKQLSAPTHDIRTLTVMQSKMVGTLTNEEVVKKAWPFRQLKDLHEDHIRILKSMPRMKKGRIPGWPDLSYWLEIEHENWKEIAEMDPLLPMDLLPEGYLGREVWAYRTKVFSNLMC